VRAGKFARRIIEEQDPSAAVRAADLPLSAGIRKFRTAGNEPTGGKNVLFPAFFTEKTKAVSEFEIDRVVFAATGTDEPVHDKSPV